MWSSGSVYYVSLLIMMLRFMVHHDGWYLFTYSTNDNITLRRSRSLTDNWDMAETKLLFKPDPESGDPWSTDVSLIKP
jgi:hypothetical protein